MYPSSPRNAGPIRRALFLSFLVASVLVAGACHAAGPDADRPDVVAEIDGQPITRAELESAATAQLRQLDAQRHQVLEQALENLVVTRLLEAEAASQKTSVERLLESTAADVAPVTDEDVDRFYTANQARMKQPKEAIAGQIRAHLTDEGKRKAQAALVSRLRSQHAVRVLFEPLRFDIDTAGAPSKGPADAAVTVVEFFDFQCPPCRRVAPAVSRLAEAYPEAVRVVYRHFPLHSIHPLAQKAAEASLCAEDQDPEAFHRIHDDLFANQSRLGQSDIVARAGELGLDGAKLAACLDEGRFADAVASDQRIGEAAGVGSTPSIFVNGRKVTLLTNVDPFDTLSALVEDELARAGGEASEGP